MFSCHAVAWLRARPRYLRILGYLADCPDVPLPQENNKFSQNLLPAPLKYGCTLSWGCKVARTANDVKMLVGCWWLLGQAAISALATDVTEVALKNLKVVNTL